MTDRIRVVTVFLDKDYRDDDVQEILSAIAMVKGVDHVEPRVVDSPEIMGRVSATIEARRRVFDALDKAMPLFPTSDKSSG